MKHVAVVAVLLVAACGSEWNMPFSNANPTMPSTVQFGSPAAKGSRAQSGESGPTGMADAPMAGARNRGTQVWLIPAPAGDLMRLAQEPELWPVAQKRVDVFSFYFMHAYDHRGFVCGNSCGPNTYPALLGAVPGGMFRWMSERYILAMEAGSVKPHACTEGKVRNEAGLSVNVAIANIKKAGGLLTYLSTDEPFTSGTGTAERNPFSQNLVGCGLSAEQVAYLQYAFNETVHAQHPEVLIGFIEPYPHFSTDEIVSFMLELEHAGVPIPYFHLDFDFPRAVREQLDWQSDVRRIREFFAARGIPFGVIVWGGDGSSDESFTMGALATMRVAFQATGVTEHTVMQSWADDLPGTANSLKHAPNTVPETELGTHTWFVLQMLRFMGIEPEVG